MKKFERNTKNAAAAELISSAAMAAYIASINAGEKIAIAMLRGSIARDLQNIGDLELGLPQLAAGEFSSVITEDWYEFGKEFDSSCYCEYVSGSGTRYLMFKDEILGRLVTDETRSLWEGV